MIINKLILLTLFTFLSCQEKFPELKSLGENNIDQKSKFNADQTSFNISNPATPLTISGTCDPRYNDMEVSFDSQITWKVFSAASSTNTDSDCSDKDYTLYLDKVNNYFTYDSNIVGNQSKYVYIRGDLGFTYSTPIKITITNSDFTPPAAPEIKTLSSSTDAKIYIAGGTESDFSHFECSVDNGIWFNCINGDVITTDGSTALNADQEGYIKARSVDNAGNSAESVSKIFKKGTLGRGVNGNIYTIEKIDTNKYLIGGDFTHYDVIPHASDPENPTLDATKLSSALLLIDDRGNILKTFSGITEVKKIKKYNSKIYIAGDFTNILGSTYNHFARLNLDLTIDTSMPNLTFNSDIVDFEIDSNNNFYFAGNFTTFKDVYGFDKTRGGLAKFNSSFEYDSAFEDASSIVGDIIRLYLDERNTDKYLYIQFAGDDYKEISTNGLLRIDLNSKVFDTSLGVTDSRLYKNTNYCLFYNSNIDSFYCYATSGRVQLSNGSIFQSPSSGGAYLNSTSTTVYNYGAIFNNSSNQLISFQSTFTKVYDMNLNELSSHTFTTNEYGVYDHIKDSDGNYILVGAMKGTGNTARFGITKMKSDYTLDEEAFANMR